MGFLEEKDETLKFKIEDALHALMKAEEIKKDKELMQEVVKMARHKKNAISSIAELKNARDKKVDKESLPEDMQDDDEEEEDETDEKQVAHKKKPNSYIEKVEQAQRESAELQPTLVKIKED